MRCIKRPWILLGMLSVAWIGCGCVHRTIVDQVTLKPIADPKSTAVVKIVKVADMRKFEVKPEDIKTPTVHEDDNINDRDVRLRSVASTLPAPIAFTTI